MQNTNEPVITLTNTDTTTAEMLTPEMIIQLQQLECWRRDQQWTEEVMHGLAANAGANQSRLFFDQMMYTVKKRAPKQLVKFMNVYIRGLKYGVHVRDSFEYAALFEQMSLLKELLARYADEESLKEWVEVYQFLSDAVEFSWESEKIFQTVSDLIHRISDKELQVRLFTVQLIACAYLGYKEKLVAVFNMAEREVEGLEQSFMKNSLVSRIALEAAYISFYVKGEFDAAEKLYMQVIANNATPYAWLARASHGLSLVTLFKSRTFCMRQLKKAMTYAKEANMLDFYDMLVNEVHPFILNMYGEYFDVEGVVPEEQVHQYVVRGDKERALQLAQEMEDSGKGSSFLVFYRAKALKSLTLLQEAKRQFENGRFSYMIFFVNREIAKMKGEMT
ncbi:AimR family lysis-lysogeny pheromone receptor [Bacillus sp. FSL W7-1360]